MHIIKDLCMGSDRPDWMTPLSSCASQHRILRNTTQVSSEIISVLHSCTVKTGPVSDMSQMHLDQHISAQQDPLIPTPSLRIKGFSYF